MIDDFNVETYIEQFNILEKGDIDCDNLSYVLYGAILKKFKITMDQDEYAYFKEYQEHIFDLIENLRELNTEIIPIVFDYLNKINHYIPDIIIMLWCFPRTDNFLSKLIYNKNYKLNIQKYNHKLTAHINHYVMKNFCVETLSKTNNIPVHCIDYIWFYMNGISLELSFYNCECGTYIGISMLEDDDEYVGFGFNMEYLLEMGLGQIIYENDSKGTFRNLLKNLVLDFDIVKKLLTVKTKNNYRQQAINICNNPSKYFGDTINEIPKIIIEELAKKN